MKAAQPLSNARARRKGQSARQQAGRHPRQSFPLPLVMMALGGMLLAVALVFSLSRPAAVALQPARVGAPMSDFTLADLNGQPVRLSDYKGQVVLVNAWATWCPPCRAEMPALNQYYQQHADQGFVILAVNAGDSQPDAASFARDYGLAFPVLLDPQIALLDGLNVRSFPTSILIGRDGLVKDIHIGMLRPEQIEAKVGPLLE